MIYPYHLGYHLKSKQFCRIPHPDLGYGIPEGCIRIIKYKECNRTYTSHLWTVPHKSNELDRWYWTLPRWSDIQRQLGEKLTGPTILILGYPS